MPIAYTAAGDLPAWSGFLNGLLDTSFGSLGIVVTPMMEIGTLLLQSNGTVVAGGNLSVDGGVSAALTAYGPDGTLDRTFGSDGIVVTRIADFPFSGINRLVESPDGKLVAAGGAILKDGAGGAPFLVRYLDDGSLDATFGLGGIVLGPTHSPGASYASVVVQENGKLVAAGIDGASGTLSRHNADGSLDSSFGVGGFAPRPIPDALALVLQPDGRIVVAGSSAVVVGVAGFTLARYLGDPEYTPTPTPTTTRTPSLTLTRAPTATPTVTPTRTRTPSPSFTLTPTTTSTPTVTPTQQVTFPGDADCNNRLDVHDVTATGMALFDPIARALCDGDCNQDDAVTAADMTCVIKLLAGAQS